MKKKIISLTFVLLLLTNCIKSNLSTFGKGVSIGFDPRTVGMQIDDTIMQKSLVTRLTLTEKKYFLYVQVEILDGRIFLTGKVDEPEEKIKITKMSWETKGVRSVKNAIEIRGQSNFKSTGKDILITTQLRTALLFNRSVKSGKTIYIFGIAMDDEEKREVIGEANKIYDVKEVIPTIYLVSELSRYKI